MQSLTVSDILKATGGSLVCGNENFEITDITTDSRRAAPGMLFVPIVGEVNDGHDYIESALLKGADCVITHKAENPQEGKNIICVEDTRKAFGDIAKYYKIKYPVPTVAITGSVGKTTTKDMIAAVLERKYNTLKTQGNFNNDIGLPITVFMQEREHTAAVLEMGMSHMDEIRYLANIARPDTAVITNIGMSHIENLGSKENIYRSKMQICDFFEEGNLLIVNGDDEFLSRQNEAIKTQTYGIENEACDLRAVNIENLGIDGSRFSLFKDGLEYKVTVKIPGVHNVYNALAAIGVGINYNIPMEDIIEGIRDFKLTGMRMEVKHFGDITVIDDCYNASPDSIRAAMKVLSDVKAVRKIAVLGDVFEMGGFAEKQLYEVGLKLPDVDILVTVGNNAKFISKGAQLAGIKIVKHFTEIGEAIEFLSEEVSSGDTLLVKASRGMHFEQITEALSNLQIK